MLETSGAPNVKVRDEFGNYVDNPGGSTLFSTSLSTESLTRHIQRIFNRCGRYVGITCAQDCNYEGKSGTFDLLIKADGPAPNFKVTTAYPKSFCSEGNICHDECKDLK